MKMLVPASPSPQEYLKRERRAKDKHEYYEGKVTALAGASLAHNRIVTNLIGEIRAALKDRPCEVLPSDIRVCIPSRKAYLYPDAVIVCGTPEMEDDQFDTLKNPRVIFEVLSRSTSAHDRGRKFQYYQEIPSFQEYVLIDSTECFTEISRRQQDGTWEPEASSDPDGWLGLEAVKIRVPLKEVYRKVF